MEEHERIRISGVINDVTFANPENGFTVLELESGDELITAVGVMPELKAGELLLGFSCLLRPPVQGRAVRA